MASIITWVLGLLFPGVPAWVAKVISTAVPAIVDVVRGLADHGAGGAAKKAAALEGLRKYLDDELDDLPGWKDLGEEKRDQLIDAMIEVVYFALKNESKGAGLKPAKPIDLGAVIAGIGKKK